MAVNRMMRFSASARRALSEAQREAMIERAAWIDIRHLLIGMTELSIAENTAAHVLNGLGVTVGKLRLRPAATPTTTPQPDLSDAVKRTLERAVTGAQQRGDKTIASAHLLFGILEAGEADKLLTDAGTSIERVRTALASLSDWTDEP